MFFRERIGVTAAISVAISTLVLAIEPIATSGAREVPIGSWASVRVVPLIEAVAPAITVEVPVLYDPRALETSKLRQYESEVASYITSDVGRDFGDARYISSNTAVGSVLGSPQPGTVPNPHDVSILLAQPPMKFPHLLFYRFQLAGARRVWVEKLRGGGEIALDPTATPYIPPTSPDGIVQGYGPFYTDMVRYWKHVQHEHQPAFEVFGHDGWVPAAQPVRATCEYKLCRAVWPKAAKTFYFTHAPPRGAPSGTGTSPASNDTEHP